MSPRQVCIPICYRRSVRLIANAAERSQVLVVTHAAKLISALEEQRRL